MVFQPGHKSPGRPPGATKLQKLLQQMGRADFDPIRNLINRYDDPECPPERKDAINEFLAPYFHPKLKQVEYTDGEGNSLIPSVIRVVLPKEDNGKTSD